MSRVQVEVCCDLCPCYPAGAYEPPLPEYWARWVLSVWRLEQATHHAHGCDATVRLRLSETAAMA